MECSVAVKQGRRRIEACPAANSARFKLSYDTSLLTYDKLSSVWGQICRFTTWLVTSAVFPDHNLLSLFLVSFLWPCLSSSESSEPLEDSERPSCCSFDSMWECNSGSAGHLAQVMGSPATARKGADPQKAALSAWHFVAVAKTIPAATSWPGKSEATLHFSLSLLPTQNKTRRDGPARTTANRQAAYSSENLLWDCLGET